MSPPLHRQPTEPSPRATTPAGDRRCAVLEAIVAGPLAWATVAQLAARTPLARLAVDDLLADLDLAGDVAAWDTPSALYATLTPIAAARLGVRIVEVGPEECPRWATGDQPEPPPPRAGPQYLAGRSRLLDLIDGREPDPADLVAETEVQEGDAPLVGRLNRTSQPGWLRMVGFRASRDAATTPGACPICELGHDDRCWYCN